MISGSYTTCVHVPAAACGRAERGACPIRVQRLLSCLGALPLCPPLQVREGGRNLQVKSLDISRAQPHLMAVASSDPHIRLYDRYGRGGGRRGAAGQASRTQQHMAVSNLPSCVHGVHCMGTCV